MKLPIQASAVRRETYQWCARAFDSVGARASATTKHHVPGTRPEFRCGTKQNDVPACTCTNGETACCPGGSGDCKVDADLCLCK
jgi:hypothetical protein